MVMLLCFMLPFTGYAARHPGTGRVVRVGFPIQTGLTQKDSEGNYTGYTVDYLNALKQYTGWEYEFVEVEGTLDEQILALMDMLQNGEIDLLGAMNYNSKLNELYAYSAYSYGTSYTVLAVRADNPYFLKQDYSSWNGIRVGYYHKNEKRMELLDKLAEVQGFVYEKVFFETYDEMMQGLDDGLIDAVLQVDLSMEKDLKSIARFNPNPYYFCVPLANSQLLEELNQGLASLQEARPGLQSQLYAEYFDRNEEFSISRDNRMYVNSLGRVRVLISSGSAPIQYVNNKGEPDGMVTDYFEQLNQKIGLSYEFVVCDSYEEGVELINSGQVDLVAAISSNSDLIEECSLMVSVPYIQSRMVLVSHNDGSLGSGATTPAYKAIRRWGNVEQQLKFIEDRKIKQSYMDYYCVDYYMSKKDLYKDITVDWDNSDTEQYSIAVVSHANKRLLNIINSYLNTIEEDTQREILYQNTNAGAQYTFSEFLIVHRWQIMLGAVVAMLIAILLYLERVSARNHMLEKTAAENERLYQFSELVNECLFEYECKSDSLRIENSYIYFGGQRRIEHFLETLDKNRHWSAAEAELFGHIARLIRMYADVSEDVELKEGTGAGWYRLTVKPILDDRREPMYVLGRIADIHMEVVYKRELEEKSMRDPLTGLYNRTGGQKKVEMCLNRANANGVMLLIDIDNFKRVNDTLGHPEGDKLLHRFAVWMKGYFLQGSVQCRLGGDEFLVYVPCQFSIEELTDQLERLMENASSSVLQEYAQYGVSLSIGTVVVTPDKKYTYAELYKAADYAMYVAKMAGKNGFFISDDGQCMRQTCVDCRKHCKRKDYLREKGLRSTDMIDVESIEEEIQEQIQV